MGQFAHLNVNFDRINGTQWEDTYLKTLSILQKFPIPLQTFRSEEKFGTERYTLSNDFVRNKDSDDEFWDIIGDFISGERAENYRMYRHRTKYSERKIGERKEIYDILYVDEEKIKYRSSSYEGTDIFGDKTQGYPFQLAVIAIGMLVENTFSGDAYFCGDISKGEAENILPWLQKQTDIPLQIPICFDAERLWKRLDKCYENKELAIERFKVLFSGSFEKEFEALLKNLDTELVIKTYAESLTGYSSLNQRGAEQILMQFFNVRQNIKELIDFVNIANSLKTEDDKKFDLKELLSVISSLFVTIPFEEREPIRLFAISAGRMVNIEEMLSRTMLGMFGTPKDVNIYMDKEKLSNLFQVNTKHGKEEKLQVVEENEKKCYEDIEKCKELIEKAEGEIQKEETEEVKEREEKQADKKSYIPEKVIDKIPEDEIYFLEQAYMQKRRFESTEASAATLGQSLKNLIDRANKEGEDLFKTNDREILLKKISKFSKSNGFSLSYMAWNSIDNETDLEKLRYLLALAMVEESGMSFWQWRTHIMESPESWDYLVQNKIIEDDENAGIEE